MKISVEFENLDEIKDFSKKFLGVDEEPKEETAPAKTTRKKKKETKVEESKQQEVNEEPKQEPKEEPKQEPTVTKEQVRDICGQAIKAGKAKETIEIVKNHGAAKVPELKESEYAAVFNEVKELL